MIDTQAALRLAVFHEIRALVYTSDDDSGLRARAVSTAATLRALVAALDRAETDLAVCRADLDNSGATSVEIAAERDAAMASYAETARRLMVAETERDAARHKEREACAVLVEQKGECRHADHAQGFCVCAGKAAAIRARGEDQA